LTFDFPYPIDILVNERNGASPMSLVANAPAAPGKPYKGVNMEGFIARWYARNTASSLAEFEALAKRIAGPEEWVFCLSRNDHLS